MKTLNLIAAATIRLSLVAGAAMVSQGDAKSPHLAADAHGAISQTFQR